MFIFSVSIAPEIWIGLKSTVPECDTKNKWVQWGQINTMWVEIVNKKKKKILSELLKMLLYILFTYYLKYKTKIKKLYIHITVY